MLFPATHKTVLVLDHGPHFCKSSKHSIEFDSMNAARRQGMIPLAPVEKSLWTCTVESTLEYYRIVQDIFPKKSLIQVITSDISAKSLNSWQVEHQNIQQMFAALGELGPPETSKEFKSSSILHGLDLAVEVLSHPTAKQHEVRTSLTEDASNIKNNGTIVCLTTFKSKNDWKKIEDHVSSYILEHNKLASSSDNLMPIDGCHLVFMHIVPVGDQSQLVSQDKTEISSVMTSQLISTESGSILANKMVELTMKQFNLSSTSITGIPMKEEQNASSSANYDVELLHPAAAHTELFATGQAQGLLIPSREIVNTETITLKWCTPKSTPTELYQCTGAYRISSIDVNSRPSACLTNFLLGGRSVMLEQPRKIGVRIVSHMLASHGGEIYIKTLHTSRSILEDPPSISEGCGGRVTDYRITDFGEVMKEHRLAPDSPDSDDGIPVDAAKSMLERSTRYWPMVIGDTIIFNMLSHIDPLPSLIVKKKLDDDEVLECKRAIYHVVSIESRNEALPIPNVGARSKGSKRDEQYRQMWSELEMLVRAHVDASPQHLQILECVLECKKPLDDKGRKNSDKTAAVKEEKVELSEVELATKDLLRYQNLTEREKLEFNNQDTKRPLAGSPVKRLKPNPISQSDSSKGPQSLLSMWTSRMNAMHSKRHNEFAGRLESVGNQAELYIHMKQEEHNKSEQSESKTATPSGGLNRR